MADRDQSMSPIEAAAAETDELVTQLFSLLGDETRLAIILALADASEPINRESWNPTGMNTMSFSELRARVGRRDPGNFNYHLGKLDGQFITHSSDGYKLLPAGSRIVKTVIAIAGFEETALPPTRIDIGCPNCRAPTAVTHQQRRMYHLCTECGGNVLAGDHHPAGVLSGVVLDQTVLRNRSPEDVVLALYAWKFYSFALALVEVCIMCSGQMEGSLHVCKAHEPESDGLCRSCGYSYEVTGQFVCSVCKHTKLWGLIPLSAIHPAGIAFCWEHSIELGFSNRDLGTLRRLFDLFAESALEIRSYEPPRVRVTLRDADDELRVSFDTNLEVTEITEGRNV